MFFKIMNIRQNCHFYTLQMINLDSIVNNNNNNHNEKRPYIPDHPYRILIIVAQDQEKQIYCLI